MRPQVIVIATALACLAACPDAPGDAHDGGGEGLPGLVLRDLKVEPNPANVLSCFVTWSTDAPATSAVEFGPGGKLAWRLRFAPDMSARRGARGPAAAPMAPIVFVDAGSGDVLGLVNGLIR